jgi:hypothetical protein
VLKSARPADPAALASQRRREMPRAWRVVSRVFWTAELSVKLVCMTVSMVWMVAVQSVR